MGAKKILITALIICAQICNPLSSKAEEILRIGAIPDQHPEKLNRLYNVLARELASNLGVKVKYVPVTNYAAAVSAFRTESIDFVWFGGLTGVQARIQKPGAKIIAQRDIDASFKSVFIANKNANIKKINSITDLKSLKGRRFTFGSESSTSGRLMPQYFLKLGGIDPSNFYGGRTGFSGSHDATIALVESGSYEVGALNKQVWDTNKISNRIQINNVVEIWITPSYADYHWLAQPDLDKKHGKGFTQRLKLFMLNMHKSKSKEQQEILKAFGATKFIKAYPSDYKSIETIGRQLGKIK